MVSGWKRPLEIRPREAQLFIDGSDHSFNRWFKQFSDIKLDDSQSRVTISDVRQIKVPQ